MDDTYMILDPDDTRFGSCLGIVIDALTGRQTAHYAGGYTVILGEELCSSCDAPVGDGPCDCEILAEEIRMREAAE